MHPVGSEKIERINSELNKLGIDFLLVEEYDITEYHDFYAFYLLINGNTIFTGLSGEFDSEKAEMLFKRTEDIAQNYLNSNSNLKVIIDASNLIDFSTSNMDHLELLRSQLSLKCAQMVIVDTVKSQDVKNQNPLGSTRDVMTVATLKEAIELALGEDGNKKPQNEEDLNNLTKEELINRVRQLNMELQESSNKVGVNLSDTALANFHEDLSLRAIFDSLDAVVWYIDRDYNLMAFNKNFQYHIKSIYGLEPQIGMNVLKQAELAQQYETVQYRIKIALTGQEETYQDFYREGGEILKVVNSKIFPIRVDQTIVGVGCLTNDETESFFNKERIKDNEKLLASINKNISEAIYRSNSETGFVYINEAFVKMFGFDSKEELLNMKDLRPLYADPKDRAKIIKVLNRKKQFTNFEMLFRKKNGDTFTGLISSIMSVDDKGIEYYDGAIRHVTEIKIAQQKLENQNLQLTKLNSELDSFVYSASHDLKAPLSSVKGLIHLAQLETDREKLEYYLLLINKSIDKLDNFIEDIINLSRNSRQEVKSQEINFEELIKESLDNFKYLQNYDLLSKDIQIDQNCPFYSDRRRISILLNNLISNSIRYYNPTASNPFLKINLTCDSKLVKISVSDNGLGIEKQYLEKIFDMFFRASNFSDGSGIGLYIVKETVEKLEGNVSVKSEYGVGSNFMISLPNSAN